MSDTPQKRLPARFYEQARNIIETAAMRGEGFNDPKAMEDDIARALHEAATISKADMVKIAKIMVTADNWCETCGSGLLGQLKTAFPEYVATINEVWNDRGGLFSRWVAARDKWEGRLRRKPVPQPEVWEV